MAITIQTRVVYENRNGESVTEVEAFKDGVKMFAPGATIYDDHGIITVKWASSSSSGTMDDAIAQLDVMKVAIALAY